MPLVIGVGPLDDQTEQFILHNIPVENASDVRDVVRQVHAEYDDLLTCVVYINGDYYTAIPGDGDAMDIRKLDTADYSVIIASAMADKNAPALPEPTADPKGELCQLRLFK